MSDDEQQRPGFQPVRQDAEGNYYVGPARHHDDTELTPEDVERKDRGEQVPATPSGLTSDGPSAEQRLERKLLVVTGPRGELQATYLGRDYMRAEQHARVLRGLVAAIDIVRDFR